jgi:hypothetical protein
LVIILVISLAVIDDGINFAGVLDTSVGLSTTRMEVLLGGDVFTFDDFIPIDRYIDM